MEDLTSEQITEWMAYDQIDPLGSWRQDYRFSFLSSLLTNIAIRSHGEKGAKLTTVKDFMFVWDPAEQAQQKEDELEKMKAILLSFSPKKTTRKLVRTKTAKK